jgi:hypothetical protein
VIPALGPAGSRRARALLAGTFLAFAAWTLLPMLYDVVFRPAATDFRLYYAAAVVGLTYGWSHLYDPALQVAVTGRLHIFFQPFINPPAMAWLAVPFTFLPFQVGHVVWTVLLLAALFAAWWLLRPPGRPPQVFWLLGFLALFPASFSIGIGQPHAFLLLAFAVAVRLRERGFEGWAGAVLGVLWLKPQLAFLLPLGLLAARQWRMLLGLAASGVLLGIVQVVGMGPHGVAQYVADLQVASTWDLQRRLSLAGLVPGPLFLVLRVLIVGLLLLASAGDRPLRNHALVAAPLASLLVTPYSGFQDLAMLVGAGWIWLRESSEWQVRAWLLVGWVAAEFTLVWGPFPIVGYELLWMVLLAVLGARRLGWVRVRAGLGGRSRESRPAARAAPDQAAPP